MRAVLTICLSDPPGPRAPIARIMVSLGGPASIAIAFAERSKRRRRRAYIISPKCGPNRPARPTGLAGATAGGALISQSTALLIHPRTLRAARGNVTRYIDRVRA